MKTTKADFELFKRECQKWIDRYELNNLKFYYKLDDTDDSFAEYYYSEWMQKITVILSKEFSEPMIDKKQQIKDTAFHEITEILLVPLRTMAEKRNFDREEMEKETHRIIHKLQKVLM